MKRSLFLAKLRSARISLERVWEMLRRPGADRWLAALVPATMIVVVWALLSLGQRGEGADGEDLKFSSYRPPDARATVCYHQSLEKARLARDVLADRCTFEEAVTAFRALHARNSYIPSLARFQPSDCTEEEALRWNVAAFLRSVLPERPEKASQVEQIEQQIIRASGGALPCGVDKRSILRGES